MSLWSRVRQTLLALDAPAMPMPRAAITPAQGVSITSPEQLEEALRRGNISASGESVTADTAMRNAAVFASVRVLSGLPANLPRGVFRRISDTHRNVASDHPLWVVLNRRPNKWQKPAQFIRMMTAHVLLRGNAYALKTRNTQGDVVALLPLHPDRVRTVQRDDMVIEHHYTRRDGRKIVFTAEEVLHLYLFTLNGFTGVTPLTYAREAIGSALTMEKHGAKLFANGANIAGALKHPKTLSQDAHARLMDGMEEFASGGAREGKTIILEEGMDYQSIGMNSADAEWIEGRKFTRSEIFMFFGVFPHTVGDAEGNTQLGSSLEQQTQGFLAFSLEDYLTMWQEALTVDCLKEADWATIYVEFNRNAIVRADLKSRNEAYAKALQWGWMNPDQVRALENMNPREDGRGGVYYDPPNMAGGTSQMEQQP